MANKALLISHDFAECGDERVSAFLRSKNFELIWACPSEGRAVPASAEPDALVVFGGKYGVPDKDRFTFLKDEMRVIGKSLKREIPVLPRALDRASRRTQFCRRRLFAGTAACRSRKI
jgi:GMP synthase-like glutamine amidotransferase